MKKTTIFAAMAAMILSTVTAAAAEAKTAELSDAGAALNGEAFEPLAYTIDGYTYFKLRDVAKALDSTAAEFAVAWDSAKRMTTLTTGAVYEDSDADAQEPAKTAAAYLSEDAVLINGEKFAPQAYNIDGYNYYKLRELGDALGFTVTWDAEARCIGISTAAAVAVNVTEDAVEYTLENGNAYIWQKEVFTEEVVLLCPPDDSRLTYEVTFIDCVFEKGLTVITQDEPHVTVEEGCVFAEGTGMTIKAE